jgi:hypothetical protein
MQRRPIPAYEGAAVPCDDVLPKPIDFGDVRWGVRSTGATLL